MNICAQVSKQYSLFIYSFTRYIQWPDAYNQGDFEILVLGETPVMEELQAMAKMKKAGERTIRITRINQISEIKKCNILFVPDAQSQALNDILNQVGTQSILVVTEEPGLGQKGSCVNFINRDGKLVFELNQNAIAKQNLKASNELTRLAIIL